MGIRDWFNGLWRRPRPVAGSAGQGPVGRAAGNEEATRWRKALCDFGYPYDLVSGSVIDEAFAAARELGRQNGFVPVVLVPGHWNSDAVAPEIRARQARERLPVRADGREFLAGLLRGMNDDLRVDPECPDPAEFDKLEPREIGPVVSGFSITKEYVGTDGSQRPREQVAIVRVPAASAAELPLYFDWGGWNGAPAPEMMVAVAQYWRQAHGAELVAMGSDLLEFHVPRPPQDHASAVALLKEHYVFSEGLEFDREVLEQTAAWLRETRSWVFWWD
jgi:hypothetical protein